jgi:calcium binding protein 39
LPTTNHSLESESIPENVGQLVNSIIQEDLLLHLANNLRLLPFEARKDTQTIFTYSLRYKSTHDEIPPAVQYIVESRPEIVIELCKGYSRPESALPCGYILLEALKNEFIAEIIFYDEPDQGFNLDSVDHNAQSSGDGAFWQFFTWINKGTFEVSTDAFKTFRVKQCFNSIKASLI